MNCLIKFQILILFLLVSIPSTAAESASTDNAQEPKSTFVLYYENDLFYQHDGYYTNAVKFRVISKPLNTLTQNGIFPDAFDAVSSSKCNTQSLGIGVF